MIQYFHILPEGGSVPWTDMLRNIRCPRVCWPMWMRAEENHILQHNWLKHRPRSNLGRHKLYFRFSIGFEEAQK